MTATAANDTTAGDIAPPDVATMRDAVGRLLPPRSDMPAEADLEVLTGLLRGSVELLIPEIEQAAAGLSHDDVPRYCALACVGEARGKLRARPEPGAEGALIHARKLARVLSALCDHFEKMTDVRMCLACDQPITAADAWVSYDRVSSSGGAAHAGRIHDRCADRVRLSR